MTKWLDFPLANALANNSLLVPSNHTLNKASEAAGKMRLSDKKLRAPTLKEADRNDLGSLYGWRIHGYPRAHWTVTLGKSATTVDLLIFEDHSALVIKCGPGDRETSYLCPQVLRLRKTKHIEGTSQQFEMRRDTEEHLIVEMAGPKGNLEFLDLYAKSAQDGAHKQALQLLCADLEKIVKEMDRHDVIAVRDDIPGPSPEKEFREPLEMAPIWSTAISYPHRDDCHEIMHQILTDTARAATSAGASVRDDYDITFNLMGRTILPDGTLGPMHITVNTANDAFLKKARPVIKRAEAILNGPDSPIHPLKSIAQGWCFTTNAPGERRMSSKLLFYVTIGEAASHSAHETMAGAGRLKKGSSSYGAPAIPSLPVAS